MSEHVDVVYLKIIFDFIEKIEKYTANQTQEEFLKDELTIDAVLLNLIQLGETANKLSEEFKDIHDGIDWFKLRGLRNRIVHDYQGTNLPIVWKIVKEDIAELKKFIEKII
jgi:uncharacterized protein with HEPN domain